METRRGARARSILLLRNHQYRTHIKISKYINTYINKQTNPDRDFHPPACTFARSARHRIENRPFARDSALRASNSFRNSLRSALRENKHFKKVHWESVFASQSERPSCLNLPTQATSYLLVWEYICSLGLCI